MSRKLNKDQSPFHEIVFEEMQLKIQLNTG